MKIVSLRQNAIHALHENASSLPALVLEQSSIQVLNLHGNPMTKEEFTQMPGADAFLQRRTQLKNKEIHGGLATDASVCGLD